MEDYKKQLHDQLKQLDQLISTCKKRLKNEEHVNKRTVCTIAKGSGYQYYYSDIGRKRTYVRKSDLNSVAEILQREYDEAVYKQLIATRDRINRFLQVYDVSSIDQTYSKMSDARKRLVTPIIPTDDEYIREWYGKFNGSPNTYPAQVQYLTDKGENVRSKTEKILADMFNKYRIPYRYEPELILKDGRHMYPDFVLLNVRRRKTIYWEHFGLIGDGEYAKKTLQKLNTYESIGLMTGEDVLFSMESDEMPLNVKTVEHKIKMYLL